MRKITIVAAILVIGLFMAGLFAAPVNAITASAPQWQVGDTWAMGKEVDLGADLTDNITELNAMLTGSNITIDDLDIDSTVGVYVVFNVVSETATTYTLTAKMAVKFATQANVKITANLPVAGTYGEDEMALMPYSTVAKENKIISLDLTEKFGIVVSATAIVDKASYALNSVDWSLRTAMLMDLNAKNIPQIDTNETSAEQTISYKNYDIGVDLVAKANVSMTFTPALDIFQFPFSEGDYWDTNSSMVTVNGDVSGFFNAKGLTAEQEEQIFSDELKNATGSSAFPIEFDHLTSPDGEITDGKFGPFYDNITSMEMYCLSGITETIGGAQYDVFTILVDDETEMVYSPGFKVLGMSVGSDSLPIELPDEVSLFTGMMGDQNMEMDPIAAETAVSKIAAIETYTDSVATQAGAKGDSGTLADFFLEAPYIGIIMVIVAAMVVAALVFVGTRPRKP